MTGTARREDALALKLADGLRFEAGPDTWSVPPLTVAEGEWVALVPGQAEPVVDPSVHLARALASLTEPERGRVEILGVDIYGTDYAMRQRTRARIGFVHGYGGLLSNRTVRENLTLPVSVHRKLTAAHESDTVESALVEFALERVADLYPHQMDGATRWRACLARALVLEPGWLVLEGLGDFEMDRGRGVGWTRLVERALGGRIGAAVCLPRQNPGFEAWFKEHEGVVVSYSQVPGAARGRNT
ncbi:MAG: ATP-binding cassette domain-containing protein [Deltaproteobacteria bacterium]|nr:ATP-binding cassette domain-containing protein [Deltaproteobacteria bacterium]